MSSPERLEKQGQLQEWKQEAIKLSAQIHALQAQIHRATDQTRGLEQVNLQEAAALMGQWQETLSAHRELCARIKELCEDLGVPMPTTDVRRKK